MWKAPVVTLNTRQQSVLKQIAKARTMRSDHKLRAQLILLFGEGYSDNRAGEQVGLKRRVAGFWRRRWLENQEKLLLVEKSGEAKPGDLKRSVLGVLSDLPRSGATPTFTAEQIARLLTLACEDPQEKGLPFSRWSLSLLRSEAIARGIVESISISRLQVFLKSGGLETTQNGGMDSHTRGSGWIRRASGNDL